MNLSIRSQGATARVKQCYMYRASPNTRICTPQPDALSLPSLYGFYVLNYMILGIRKKGDTYNLFYWHRVLSGSIIKAPINSGVLKRCLT